MATMGPMVTKKRRRASTPRKTLKDETVRMRVSADEKQAMEATASRDGLSLSAWLRRLALRAAGMLTTVEAM